MASPIAAADEERRDRIMTHMNKAHARELSHYLRHYAGVSRRDAARPSMRDVTLQGMRIRANGIDYTIPFEPPLDSWADVKTRIIDIDTTAREHLGISDVYLAHFEPPRGFGLFVLASVLFYVGCCASLPWVVPGSVLWNAVDAVFPGGAAWFRWTVCAIFIPVLAIHVAESTVFDVKLQRHGVDRGTGLWWLWMAACFFGGLPAFWTVDRIVAEKRAEKEGKRKKTCRCRLAQHCHDTHKKDASGAGEHQTSVRGHEKRAPSRKG